MSRFQLLSDAQWSLIEGMLPRPTGRPGRKFSDARTMLEGIIYRYRCGIAWRDLPEVFGSAEGLVESGVYAASVTASIIMVSNSMGVSFPSRR